MHGSPCQDFSRVGEKLGGKKKEVEQGAVYYLKQ